MMKVKQIKIERRKKQLAQNHQDRKLKRQTFTPLELAKMKLSELQAMAPSMGIELENNEPGKGKGRGSKKTKTIKFCRFPQDKY